MNLIMIVLKNWGRKIKLFVNFIESVKFGYIIKKEKVDIIRMLLMRNFMEYKVGRGKQW